MQNERNLVYGVYANSSTDTFSVIGMIRAVKTKPMESLNSGDKELVEIPIGSFTVALSNRFLDVKNKIVSTKWNFLMLKSVKHKVKLNNP